jgi:uncharacterized protein YegL
MPTSAPSGCITTEARLHVTFKKTWQEVVNDISRNRSAADFEDERRILQTSLAMVLKLKESEIPVTLKDGEPGLIKAVGIFNKVTSKNFEQAIKLGYELEQKVLKNLYNPIPGFPIHRLVMETVFQCEKVTYAPTVPAPQTYAPTHAPTMKGCKPADVVLVLDSSKSIEESDWKKFVHFTHSLIDTLPIDPDTMRLGIIEFNTNAKLVSGLSSNKAAIQAMVDSRLSKTSEGKTYTDKAVRLALDDLAKNARDTSIPKLMLILTDGLPSNRTLANAAFADAKRKGVLIQLVTIGWVANIMPVPASWSSKGFPPLKMMGGYSELVKRMSDVAGAVCGLTAKFEFTNAPLRPYTPVPLMTPTELPSSKLTTEPSAEPSAEVTEGPTREPTTVTPTEEPTAEPTQVPTEEPTTLPPTTDKPSFSPTVTPTEEPSAEPSATPTEEPSAEPSAEPSVLPTVTPTVEPTALPTFKATLAPTKSQCRPADMSLVLDSSESIAEVDWQKFLQFTAALVDNLPINKDTMHLGVVEFNSDAKLVTALSSSKSKISSAVATGLSKFTEGRTYTDKAVRVGLQDLAANGRGANIPKLMVVLTDGLPSNHSAAAKAFADAKKAGVQVQLVTIGWFVNLMPVPAEWSAENFPPLKMTGGYQELLERIETVIGTICDLTSTIEQVHPSIQTLKTEVSRAPTIVLPGTSKCSEAIAAPRSSDLYKSCQATWKKCIFSFHNARQCSHAFRCCVRSLASPCSLCSGKPVATASAKVFGAPVQIPAITLAPVATIAPTEVPTEVPTSKPSATPTEEPSTLPPSTNKPSFAPTGTPTETPTTVPTAPPTEVPTVTPTVPPTKPAGECQWAKAADRSSDLYKACQVTWKKCIFSFHNARQCSHAFRCCVRSLASPCNLCSGKPT